MVGEEVLLPVVLEYGGIGLAAVALGVSLKYSNDANVRATTANEKLQAVNEKMQDVITRNTDAMYALAAAIDKRMR